MIFLVVLVLGPLVLGVLAVRFGADSRDGRDWQPRDSYAGTGSTSVR